MYAKDLKEELENYNSLSIKDKLEAIPLVIFDYQFKLFEIDEKIDSMKKHYGYVLKKCREDSEWKELNRKRTLLSNLISTLIRIQVNARSLSILQ